MEHRKKNNRETEPKGLGWELFKNFLIAKEKFKPDFFLYENNKSAAQPIKDQISRELGVDLMYINSALVSAQNRQRFYAFNWEVEQPEDRGIVLRDILETSSSENSYSLSTGSMVTSSCATTIFEKCVAPIRIGDIGSTAQAHRVYSCDGKSVTLSANGGGQGGKTGLYTVPMRVSEATKQGYVDIEVGDCVDLTMPNSKTRRGRSMKEKSNCLTTASSEFYQYCGTIDSNIGECAVFGVDCTENGKSQTIKAQYGGAGLYAVPLANPERYLSESMVGYAYKEGTKNFKQRVKILEDKSCPLTTAQNKRAGTTNYIPQDISTIDCEITTNANAKNAKPIYEIKDGLITINDKQYPIKLKDGYYIIRKLTPIECERLQTLPDNYTATVSNAQRYKGLGNGWTAEVIIHILNGALKDVPRDEEIVVLSMYDGIGTGRYCLDKMGFTNVKYFAYEIDKYAKQVAMSNYPDIIQMGDALNLRHPDWTIGY